MMLPISEAMRAALTAPTVEFDFGVDLLDAEDRVVGDLSADVTAMSVEHTLRADVHRTCTLELTRDLVWGVDRVRPWVSANGYSWLLGVFLLTTPEQVAGESPRTRTVTGMDKLWLLQREVGDTYVVPAGTSYLDAIRGVLTDAGVTGGLLLQGDRQTTALDEPAVWPLLEDGYTWLDVANGLLGMIAYQGLWVDEMGRFRSAPVVDPHTVGTAWTFDTTDVLAGVVGEDRTLSADVYDLPNYWRFVRNKDRALTADDTYVVDRTDGLLPQQVRRRMVYLDVADRAALVAEGDRIVAEDTATERIATLSVSPLPFEHGDVVQLRDPDLGLTARGVVRRWSIDQDGNTDVDVEVVG